MKLLKGMSPLYYGGTGGNHFMGSERDFVLKDYKKNFYQPIMLEAIAYFKNNGISWWGGKNPTGHILSSQIACINHLYPIRNDKEAVLGLLRIISPDFVDVLQISTDKQDMGYIQFESVSDYDYLNEGQSTRGSNCTSVDALIYAVHKNGSNWLIPIEWKYTEHYSNMNKADEGCKKDPQNCKGKVRRSRYTDLINGSDQLKGNDHYCYYFEPFYQLMRQTLWAEQMVRNKTNETIKADDYLHVHVIPSENKDLLTKKYKCSNLGMEETWREHLVAQKKYKIISPYDLLSSIVDEGYDDLFTYLNGRYWNGS
ncbi:MAG: hypothetical protein K9N29_03175 [Candidatus Marinimicrobia bacterium]|nr:hypothetical protein [Candidatus Neomarinimicrobiota bacterium]